MKKNRNMKYTYKGFVCRDDKAHDKVKLGVMYGEQIYFMEISDHENIYEQTAPNQANIIIVEFQDGTEPVDFERAKDGEFENVFIWIHDLVRISLDEFDGYLLTLINEDPKNAKELSEAVERAYVDKKIIKKIKEYKNYTKSWVETH